MLAAFTPPAFAGDMYWFGSHRPRTGKCPAGTREVAASIYYCDGLPFSNGEHCRDGLFAASNMPDGFRMGSLITITNARHQNRSVTVRRVDTLPNNKAAWHVGVRLDLMPEAFKKLGPLGPQGQKETGWVCAR